MLKFETVSNLYRRYAAAAISDWSWLINGGHGMPAVIKCDQCSSVASPFPLRPTPQPQQQIEKLK